MWNPFAKREKNQDESLIQAQKELTQLFHSNCEEVMLEFDENGSYVDLYSVEQYRKERFEAKLNVFGGCGVTSRDLKAHEDLFPGVYGRYLGIKEHLLSLSAGSKIVILGSGLSTMPFELIDQNPSLIGSIHLVDVLNYETLSSALKSVIDASQFRNLTQYHRDKITGWHRSANTLSDLIHSGAVTYSQGLWGQSRNTFLKLAKADAVINCFGPGMSSLEFQLSLLDQLGVGYIAINHNEAEFMKTCRRLGFSVSRANDSYGYRVTRI